MASKMMELLDASVCEIPKPKRESLISNQSPPCQASLNGERLIQIRRLVEDTLFVWTDFTACPPPSLLVQATGSQSGSLDLKSTFVPQDFEEVNLSGGLLNDSQLTQLRHFGKFDIESRSFPDHFYTWKVRKYLQQGKENILQELKTNIINALEMLVIKSKDRFVGNYFSVKVAAFSLLDFLEFIFDLFIGWPHVHHDEIDQKLLEERLNFLTCDLSIKGTSRKELERCWYFTEKLSLLPDTYILAENERLPKPPFCFITSSKLSIDLRIFNTHILEKCLVIINRLRSSCSNDWFEKFKADEYNSLKNSGKTFEEILSIISARSTQAFAQRLFDKMKESEELKAIDPTIAEALVQHAMFYLAVQDAKADLLKKWLNHQRVEERQIEISYPMLWSIRSWRERHMANVKKKFMRIHKLDVHKAVLEKCKELGLSQYAYFVNRDILFSTDRETLVHDELSKAPMVPDNTFEYHVPCRLLRHWSIYRKDKYIPNKWNRVEPMLWIGSPNKYRVTQAPKELSIANSTAKSLLCSAPDCEEKVSETVNLVDLSRNIPDHEFTAVKHWTFKSSTQYFFWRWFAFFLFTFAFLLRSWQLFLYTIPFQSPLGLPALFLRKPIYVSAEIDQETGYLFYTKQKTIPTFHSRLLGFWQTTYATADPSSTLLKKCLHYTVKAILPSIFLVVFMPSLCIITSFLSILVGLLLPFFIPTLSIIFHFLGIIFWDIYKPTLRHNRWFPVVEAVVWHLVIRCLFQFFGALAAGLVFYPLQAICIALYAVAGWLMCSLWDWITFHIGLKHCLRIPAQNTAILKKVSGPGTTPNTYFKVELSSVFLVLLSRLEACELDIWKMQVERIAKEPFMAYKSVIESLTWLSLSPVDNGLLGRLRNSTQTWLQHIASKYEVQRKQLRFRLSICQLTRVKMTRRDMQKFLTMGIKLTETFYRTRIYPRLQKFDPAFIEKWWKDRELEVNDFSGLCIYLVKNVFGEQFSTTLKRTDIVFPLQVCNSHAIEEVTKLMALLAPEESTNASLKEVRAFSSGANYAVTLPRCLPSLEIANVLRRGTSNPPTLEQASGSASSQELDEICLDKTKSKYDSVIPAHGVRFERPASEISTSSTQSDLCMVSNFDPPMLPLTAFIPDRFLHVMNQRLGSRFSPSSLLILENHRSNSLFNVLQQEVVNIDKWRHLPETDDYYHSFHLQKPIANFLHRSFTRQWQLDGSVEFNREKKPTYEGQIGMVQHPVEIALTMYSRMQDDRFMNTKHIVVKKYVEDLLSFPPKKLSCDTGQGTSSRSENKVGRQSRASSSHCTDVYTETECALPNSKTVISASEISQSSAFMPEGLKFDYTQWWGDSDGDQHFPADLTDVPSMVTTSFVEDDEDPTNNEVCEIESILDSALMSNSVCLFAKRSKEKSQDTTPLHSSAPKLTALFDEGDKMALAEKTPQIHRKTLKTQIFQDAEVATKL